MLVIINISSNLLQTLSSFLTNNSKCYATKNGKYHNVTSLKIDVIGKYYYIRKKRIQQKTTTAIIIEKVQKYQSP